MELRGIRLKGDHDELRVSTGRVMNAYQDRRRRPVQDVTIPQKSRPRRGVPSAMLEVNPAKLWVVSGFFLISTPEVRRWSGSSDLWFESSSVRFHVVSLEPWKAGSLSNPAGFETWNFRAMCAPEAHQLELLPAFQTRKLQAETDENQ
jgi:hypothetical protein